ncbi:Mitochondrial assembly of ribosomal large subunit protein 1 [Phytophthora boehmeriae]|uniref:Mitochondrial assembly of ribosomal large subunit protein 1 n=1 Tax=Phytophthora boehmeriae TaxID=109152 RepID=A0A8T1VQP3_9STRA|nr:Mitochondrial assembly of ribosomal large subunit protein 1 [Phytophthora boehmeriae]
MTSQLLRQAIRLRSQVISRCHSNIYQARALQTLFLRAIAKPCVVEEVHVAETENEAANEYLGVRYNATKIKKYSAEPEMNGQVLKRGDFWTALDAAKAYDKLVVAYCETDSPRNFK